MKTRGIILSVVTFFALISVPVFAATDMRGEWTCCSDLSPNLRLGITSGTDALGGTFYQIFGAKAELSVMGKIGGTVKGDAVKLVILQTDGNTNTFTGKLIDGGNAMRGSWERQGPSNSGTVTLTRLSTTLPPELVTPVVPATVSASAQDKSDPVLRIIDIKNKNDKSGQPPGPIVLEYFRDGKWQTAPKDFTLRIGDKLRTGPDTIAAFEFLIGGRMSLNAEVEVTITSDRGVKETVSAKEHLRRGVNLGGRIAKTAALSLLLGGAPIPLADDAYTRAMKTPIEIQTNGGVLGIRG